jgi:lysozyme family protein
MWTFADLKWEYETLWDSMRIRPEKSETVTRLARKLIRAKPRYETVASRTGVPWFVVAALHERESGADFSSYLGNGEPLTRRTVLVPRGRGPFTSWEDGAFDALGLDGLDKVKEWTPARACYEIEKFNGFGYRVKATRSPYLWSFSNHYARGKFVADGLFNARVVDAQCGAIPLVKRITELDATARFPLRSAAETAAGGGIVAGGAAVTQQAMQHGASLATVVTIVLITAVIAAATFFAVRRYRHG